MKQIFKYWLALVLAKEAQNIEPTKVILCNTRYQCETVLSTVSLVRLLSADKEKALGVAQCIVVWPHCFGPCGEVTHDDGITW